MYYEVEQDRFVQFLRPFLSDARIASDLVLLLIDRYSLDPEEPPTGYRHPIAAALAYEAYERISQAEVVSGSSDLRLFLLVLAAERLHAAWIGVRNNYVRSGEIQRMKRTRTPGPNKLFGDFFKQFCPGTALNQIASYVQTAGMPELDKSIQYLYHLRSRIAHRGPRFDRVSPGFGWDRWELPQELRGPSTSLLEPIPLVELRDAIIGGWVNLCLIAMDDLCREKHECWGHQIDGWERRGQSTA